jgi:hypothetical protein
MSASGPPIENLLTIFWEGGYQYPGFSGFLAQSANLVFGANPPYQVSDFLAVYPKFGSQPLGIVTATLGAGGSGYQANDVATIVQPDATNGQLTVNSVDGSGAVLTFTITNPGSGYSVASGVATSGGHGTGFTVNITNLTPPNLILPQAVIQMYINLAQASLTFNRWLDYWQVGMSLFVAHFCTLYLRSEGNVGSTAGQIANSGLEKGITVSKSAGDVSLSAKPLLDDLEGFASWGLTSYGAQLATFARIVGMGPSYIY